MRRAPAQPHDTHPFPSYTLPCQPDLSAHCLPLLTKRCVVVVPMNQITAVYRQGMNTSLAATYATRCLIVWWATLWGQATLKAMIHQGAKTVKKKRGSQSTRAAALLMPLGHAAQSFVVHSTVMSGSRSTSSYSDQWNEGVQGSGKVRGHVARAGAKTLG